MKNYLIQLLFGSVLFASSITVFAQQQPLIVDGYGRTLVLHGLNTSSSAKNIDGHQPWINENDVALEVSEYGFNTVRYLIFWGAIEPQKGVYDTAYLKQVRQRVEWYTSRGVYVMLDMHQDVFGYGVGGNGAPAWACANPPIKNLIPDKWPWWLQNLEPKVIKSYAQFFRYKRHKQRQDHYLLAFQKVAALFKDNPHVLGYDLMNEPHGGKLAKTVCGGFERQWLKKFYGRLIPAIRQVDTAKYVFFEPKSFGVNFGMPSRLPKINDPAHKLVYSAHCYMPFVDVGGDYDKNAEKQLARWFKRRDHEIKKQGTGFLLGEFGLSPGKKGFDKYLQYILRELDKRNASWTYWSSDLGGWGPFDSKRNPSPIMGQILSVYPSATAGKLLSENYDAASKSFEMTYISDATIHQPTEIIVPHALFTNGYTIKVTGTDKWHEEKDDAKCLLKIFVDESGKNVVVKVTPK